MIKDKLKICIVKPNSETSSETFISNHIKYLPANISVAYGGWLPEINGEHQSLSRAYIHRNLFSNIFSYACKLLPQQIFISLPSTITGLPLKNRTLLKKAFRYYLKKKNIQVVLAEYGLTGVAIMDVCKELKIPFVVHFHGFDAYVKAVLEENKDAYEILFQRASKIIVVSKHMLEQLTKLGAPPDKLKLNLYGVDINKFSPPKEKPTSPIFLFSGRFVNKKTPHLVLLCFSKILLKIPDARLIMIGDGGYGSSQELYLGCKQMVEGLKIGHAVDFKGGMTNDEVADQMQKALIFIQHSVTTEEGDSEGTPVSLLEACASGLAVIGTKHAGIPEVIIHGETGFLVNEYDLENTLACMFQLANNIPLAHSMGLKARQRIVDNYSLDKSIENLSRIIDSVNN